MWATPVVLPFVKHAVGIMVSLFPRWGESEEDEEGSIREDVEGVEKCGQDPP